MKDDNRKKVPVNRGTQDSYYKSAASKLSVSEIKKQVNRETKLINRYKFESGN